MIKKKSIIALTFCLAHILLYAQTSYEIGAIAETDSHLWTLKTIERYNDSLAINWLIKNKTPKSTIKINENNIVCKDLRTGIKHKPIKLSTPTICHDTPYSIDSLRIVFPPIKDTLSLISISVSPEVLVDSISLPNSNTLVLSQIRFKIPYCHKPLLTRKDSVVFSDSLYTLGMALYRKELYQEALICFEKCYIFDRLLDDYTFLSALKRGYNNHSKKWVARCLYKVGLESRAKALDSDYMFEPFDRKLVEKADSIYNTFNMTLYKSNDEKIVEYKKICTLDSMNFGVNHYRYALSLYDLGQCYSSCRDFSKAKYYLKKSFNIITRLSKENWLEMAIAGELARIANEEEDFISAIRYKEYSLGITNDSIDFSKEFFLDFFSLADYYTAVGDWDKALLIGKNRVAYWKKQYDQIPSESFSYTWALQSYASTLVYAGRYKEAFRVCKQVIDINPLNNLYLTDLGHQFYNLRDYQNALICYKKALEGNTLILDIGLNNLAICHAALGDYKKAIQTQKECIAKIDPSKLSYSTFINRYASYATYLSNLASMFNWNEEFDSALVYEKKSLELKEKYCSPHSDEIAYSYMNMGIALGGKGLWEEAIEKLLFSYDIYKKQQNKELYNRTLFYLSKFSFNSGEYEKLDGYITKHLKSASEDLFSTFQELIYDERSRYIEKYSDLMNQQIPMYTYYTHSNTLTETSYNASLIMKGALLSSENSVKEVVEESKDNSLKDLWYELKADRYILSKQLEKDSLSRKLNLDSLQNVINSLEDSLVVKCKEYGDIARSMKMTWKDIQTVLQPKDIAIEFLSFPINNDSVIFAALTLRKDSDMPKMTVLFEEKQLKNLSDTIYFNCKEMTDLVWRPLLPELESVKNIYFSPAGALYNIGIEYLPGMEEYNLYRLSSTRELVVNSKQEQTNNAVLYGGLDYYAKLDTTKVNDDSFLDDAFIYHADVRGMNLRGGMEALPQTKVEVEQIGEELNKAKWSYQVFTDEKGTEASFKSLSGKKIKTLHISTHGFYYTKEDADNLGYDFLQLMGNHTSSEDKSLTRSGLIMAGANHILEGEDLPDNVEDGILTAKEIADVDLRGLDLVVLSACQTGLGDISQGEGVFGLQRGFKKAGANSILMSLWEVNDEATQILMTQFYRNLL